MSKRIVIAIIAIFIAWSAIDFVTHGILLKETYDATASLWRPMEEMKMPMMYAVTLASTLCFVFIYECLVFDKSLASGIKLGILFGLVFGISGGFGSYTYMPIPMSLAQAWFASLLLEGIVAGALVGMIITRKEELIA
jgi:hypothetical protein